MTQWICQFCTGTHYLNDTPALGPCVCCTPQTITDLRNSLEAERAAHNGLFEEVNRTPHSAQDIEDRRKARSFDQLFDAWDRYCVMIGAGLNAVSCPEYVRTHKPLFAELWEAVQAIRRKVTV